MDPLEFLTTTDELKRMIMQSIAHKFKKDQERIDRNRAILISNAVWSAVKKK